MVNNNLRLVLICFAPFSFFKVNGEQTNAYGLCPQNHYINKLNFIP